MSSRTAARNKGVAEAWKREKQLILEGKGTRDWSESDQKLILDGKKPKDGEGHSYEAHHMKNVSDYPDYADDVNNMQILSKYEHINGAHGGNTHIKTNGYYNPLTGITTDFGENPPIPCEIIELSVPVVKSPKLKVEEKKRPHQKKKSENKKRAGPKPVERMSEKEHNYIDAVKVDSKQKKEIAGIIDKVTDFYIKHQQTIDTVVNVAQVAAPLVAESIVHATSSRGGRNNGGSKVNTTTTASTVTNVVESMTDSKRKSPIPHAVSGYVRMQNGKPVQVSSYHTGKK